MTKKCTDKLDNAPQMQVDKGWRHCRKELVDRRVEINNFELIAEEATDDVKLALTDSNINRAGRVLNPQVKQFFWDCLERKHLLSSIVARQRGFKSSFAEFFELIFGWPTTPKRYLIDELKQPLNPTQLELDQFKANQNQISALGLEPFQTGIPVKSDRVEVHGIAPYTLESYRQKRDGNFPPLPLLYPLLDDQPRVLPKDALTPPFDPGNPPAPYQPPLDEPPTPSILVPPSPEAHKDFPPASGPPDSPFPDQPPLEKPPAPSILVPPTPEAHKGFPPASGFDNSPLPVQPPSDQPLTPSILVPLPPASGSTNSPFAGQPAFDKPPTPSILVPPSAEAPKDFSPASGPANSPLSPDQQPFDRPPVPSVLVPSPQAREDFAPAVLANSPSPDQQPFDKPPTSSRPVLPPQTHKDSPSAPKPNKSPPPPSEETSDKAQEPSVPFPSPQARTNSPPSPSTQDDELIDNSAHRKAVILASSITAAVTLLLALLLFCCIYRKKKKEYQQNVRIQTNGISAGMSFFF